MPRTRDAGTAVSLGCAAVPDAPDLIEIRGLRALGIIGVCPEEQVRPQPFEVDFDLETDLRAAGRTTTCATPSTTGSRPRWPSGSSTTEQHLLLERVAQRIAEELLAIDRVEAVRVTIRKLRPPLPNDVATSAVTIRAAADGVTRAFLALGSNLGDRVAPPARRRRRPAGPRRAARRVYETDPVGGPDGQGPYLNMVVELDTARSPQRAARAWPGAGGGRRPGADRALGAAHARRGRRLDGRRRPSTTPT